MKKLINYASFCLAFFFIFFLQGVLIGVDVEKTNYIKTDVDSSGWKTEYFPSRFGKRPGKMALLEINGQKHYGRMFPAFENSWKDKDSVYLIVTGPLFFDVFLHLNACPKKSTYNFEVECIQLMNNESINKIIKELTR